MRIKTGSKRGLPQESEGDGKSFLRRRLLEGCI